MSDTATPRAPFPRSLEERVREQIDREHAGELDALAAITDESNRLLLLLEAARERRESAWEQAERTNRRSCRAKYEAAEAEVARLHNDIMGLIASRQSHERKARALKRESTFEVRVAEALRRQGRRP